MNNSGAVVERIGLVGSIVTGTCLLALGTYLAVQLRDPHWMNRAGAAIVVVQLVAVVAEYARRTRLQRITASEEGSSAADAPRPARAHHHHVANADLKVLMEHEALKAEREAFAVVFILAAIGELLHGFGDLILEAVQHLFSH